MNKKLTLFVDDAAIEKAKKYAKGRNMSISKMVEAYLKAVSLEERKAYALPPVTAELFGVLKGADKSDFKEEYASYLQEKYR